MPSSTITVGVSSSSATSKTISVNSSYIIDSIDFYGSGADGTSRNYSYTLATSIQGSITNSPHNTYNGSTSLNTSSSKYLGSVRCGLSGLSSIMVGVKNISSNGYKLYLDYVVVNYSNPSVTSDIYYYNGSSLHYHDDTNTGTAGNSFTYYLVSKPSKTGYTFKGWGTSSSASTTYSEGASRTGYYGTDYTWYANWTINTYTISYNANGGSGAPSSQTKTYNVALTLSDTEPRRDGYEFLGWATSPTATSATYSAGGSYTSNSAATLYAVWKILSYDVTFFNSKDGINIQEPIVESLEYGSQVDLTSSRNFTRPGYKFLGWGKTEDSIDILTEYTVTASNLQSLYSLWELMSNIRVYDGENWQIAIPYIYDGENWKLSISKVFNGEEWSQ